MNKRLVINHAFVVKWQARYDGIADDEDEYKGIKKMVREEIADTGSISKHTLKRIFQWKAARAWGYVDRDNISRYTNTIADVLHVKECMRIAVLDKLPGIGIPIASTILHFIHPAIFPIVDIRTVETLQQAGNLNASISVYHYRNTIKGYESFRSAIKELKARFPRSSFREIDRALFAYHKVVSAKLSCE